MSLRKLLGKIFLLGMLELGAVCGVPMTPQKIEELMKMAKGPVVEMVQKESSDGKLD